MKKIRYPHKAMVVSLYQNGLGIARDLARRGVPVMALGSTKALAGIHTRYAQIHFCKNIDDESCLVESLIALGRNEKEKSVLFLTNDHQVHIVSRRRSELSEYYYINMPQKETVMLLLEKTMFAPFAQKKGFSVPQSIILKHNNVDDGDIRFPCIIKPTYKTVTWWEECPEIKAYRADTRKEFEQTIAAIRQYYTGDLIIQEWIPGNDNMIYFCLMYYNKQGELCESFSGRKLIQWPPQLGNTCIAENVHNNEIERWGRQLFDAVDYRGCGSVEFKFDQRDQTFKITEPTVGRTNLQSGIALLHGSDIPWAYYCDMVGIDYESPAHRSRDVLWSDEGSVLRYVSHYGGRDVFNLTMLKKFLCYKKGFAYFSWRDPMPFIVFVWRMMNVMIGKIKKLRNKKHEIPQNPTRKSDEQSDK